MLLFNKPPQETQATTTTTSKTSMATPAPDLTTRATPTTTTTTAVSSSSSSSLRVPSYLSVRLPQRLFNIASPNKPKLAMELIFEMDTPQKVPLMREELVNGSTLFIETHNNQQKIFTHIPKFSNEAYTMS
jgi:hypothetical protein